MKHLYNKLNFDINPLVCQHNLTTKHYRIDSILINPKLSELLRSCDINLHYVECFNRLPGEGISIHNDHTQNDECVKINWIYGGQGSTMQWFKPKDNVTGKAKVTSVNSNYVMFMPDEVEHLATLETKPEVPYLLQAGVPHTVFNDIEPRSCISMILYDKDYLHLSMSEALIRLESFIVS